MGLVVGITGHRPGPLGGYRYPNPIQLAVVKAIEDALLELKPSILITGMALGTDQWAAEVCIHHNIPFAAFVPYPDYGDNWPPHAQAHYQWLLSKANQRINVDERPGYDPRKLHGRNAWIVEKCELLLAVYNGTSGGTQACLGVAARQHRPVRYLPLPLEAMPSTVSIPMPSMARVQPYPVAIEPPSDDVQPISPRVVRIIE